MVDKNEIVLRKIGGDGDDDEQLFIHLKKSLWRQFLRA
jgi:hypothetical protein